MRYNTKWHRLAQTARRCIYYTALSVLVAGHRSRKHCKDGKTDVDRALIHLPLLAVVDKSDYIAKGDIDFDVTASVAELLKAVSPLKISTVERKDYGSPIMRHTEVTAK